MADVILDPKLPLPKFKSGKVREVYEVGSDLLVVATDRISAYDSILPDGIPNKGRVLTQISVYWFDHLRGIVGNHLITADAGEYPAKLKKHKSVLSGRSMLVRRAEVFPIECVVRGYLSGSAWKEYKKTGSVCGIKLPPGLVESSKLPEPIFTPATKAESGHDINISFEESVRIVGDENARKLRELSLAVYNKAAEHALSRGIIIADTKFEFGVIDGEIRLVDEVLTPDSSRFWPKDGYKPGGAQPSFDKQYVRDYLDKIGWDHSPPAPNLSGEVVAGTSRKYIEAYERITGRKFF
jgi:phosphoribosylaminoimidazole-succinocarboxamide synthase